MDQIQCTWMMPSSERLLAISRSFCLATTSMRFNLASLSEYVSFVLCIASYSSTSSRLTLSLPSLAYLPLEGAHRNRLRFGHDNG